VQHKVLHTRRSGRLVPHNLPRAWLLAAAVMAGVSLTPGLVPVAGAQALPGAAPLASEPLQGRVIARLEVVGNKRTDTALILSQVRSATGARYSRAEVDVDVRTIAALERFVSVRADVVETPDGRVIVRFVVEERALVAAIQFAGNQVKNDEQIRELLTTRLNGPVDPFSIQTDIKAIEEMYRKDAYWWVRVQLDDKLLKDQGIVKYNILEGPRSRIRGVRYEGSSLDEWYVWFKCKVRSYTWILRPGALSQQDLDDDVSTIMELHRDKGYLDAKVAYYLDFKDDKSKVTVYFSVQEGPEYKVRNINVTGNKVYTRDELMGDTKMVPGVVARKDIMDALRKRMADAYGSEGYIYSRVEVVTSYTDEPGVVDVTYKIDEGESYQVGQVIVRGNTNTQDKVVRRQIRVYPDQSYDMVKVKKSIDRLKATRLFSDVKVTPVGNEPGVRDVQVEVEEGQTGKFLIGAGVSSNSGLVGQISLEQQNFDIANGPRSPGEFFRGQSFKGAGQFMRVLLEPGTDFQRYRLTFEEPYLFDTIYSFGNDLYYFVRSRESHNEQRIGDVATFGRRFGDIWSVSLAFRAEQVNIKSVEVGAAPEIIAAEGDHAFITVKPGVSRDDTDSRSFPTDGTRSSLSLENYLGDLAMGKLVARFDWYYPVYSDVFDRRTVLSVRNEVGVVAYGESAFYERFYLGGMGSLRGFKFRGISPRAGANADPVGGDFSWVTTVELNFPIFQDALRGVVFTDIGTVSKDIGIDTIRADVGFGFRFTLPLLGSIPIAVDFALPLAKDAGDKTQFLSFSLGGAF
jgi:outer membrane protein insertion porin family